MQKVYEFLKKCKTFYLATVEDDQPRVRPFGLIEIFEGKLYIHTGKMKNVSTQIKINPKIEICGCDDGKWIRVQAIAIGDDRVEANQYILDAHSGLKNRYTVDNSQAFYLKDVVATISSYGKEPEIIKF